jgi:tRNA pseudouridine55 synthase
LKKKWTKMSRRGGGKNRDCNPPIDGLLLVDKPMGKTSHDLVDVIRRRFKLLKVGHGGTLDPMATGLLVMLLGKGTKSSQQVMNGNKVYEGRIHFGISTDSHDKDGKVVEERDPGNITREMVEAAMAPWNGEVEQIPPMVSAIKKGGQPLYKLARLGQTVEREARPVTIHKFELLDYQLPVAHIRLGCSKGTYVRTLAHDIGETLGVGGHLCELRRTHSGEYDVAHALTIEALEQLDYEGLKEHVLPLPPPAPKA